MTAPVKTFAIIPPPSGTPVVDTNGILTPAWRSYFSQALTPKVNQLANTAITSVNTTAQNGVVVSQTQTDNAYSQLLSLEQNLNLTSFNGITGLSNSTPLANSGTGGTGFGTTVARADHFHPLTGAGTGTVTSVALSPANGFGGSVATPSTTPVITLTCSVAAGMVKSSGTGLVTAAAGTDFVAPGGALGTPSSGTLTNCGGTAASLTAGNASQLLTSTWAAPASIGSITPAAGAFTTLSTSGLMTANLGLTVNGGPINLAASTGIVIASGAPGTTTNALYQAAGTLYFNGVALATGGAGTGRLLNIQTFTAGGTYTKATNNPSFVVVEGVGGGGGGAGGNSTNSSAGAAGGYTRMTISNANILASETVTIGAAGAAGTSAGNGGTGGTSSFGSHCSATGGMGGQISPNTTGSLGGIGSGGDLNLRGGGGGQGDITEYTAGPGGNSFFGGGGPISGGTGLAGSPNTGGGGSSGAAGGTGTGGVGGTGLFIVYEYS